MGFFSRRRAADDGRGSRATTTPDPLAVVRAYHAATCHDFGRFATGPLELDWETQPDPFRRYAGAEVLQLARPEPTVEPRYEPAFHRGSVAPRPFDAEALGQLFFDSLALSAWKQSGEARWALRCNPSSGNLHPTEAYLVAPALAGLSDRPFVAHYASDVHGLERRAFVDDELFASLARGFAGPVVFVGLTSIAWREAWKYGERAFRYCQMDLGHALGALSLAAAGLGWRVRRLDGPSSDELAALCGVFDQVGDEREEPDVLLAFEAQDAPEPRFAPPADLAARFRALQRFGTPNELSSGHVDWDALDAIALATRKAATVADPTPSPLVLTTVRDDAPEPLGLRAVVRARRSATAFDPNRALARAGFVQTLARTLAGDDRLIAGPIPGSPRVDLVVFVHRVEGLASGAYLLLRDPARREAWTRALGRAGELRDVDTAPWNLALVELRLGDVRALARSIACHQEIASDGCFSVAAFADLEGELVARGPRAYRELHWEAGFVVHLLYLEAEALGLAGTGIGCFFDQPTSGALGMLTGGPVCLYQFACGARRDDPRLSTLPAYG
ncbi:MAG: nitroreductase family protein [Planctomycetes bacterium]|nr:nitroreductase family protein [Planctomycetota bacterium]